MIVHAAVFTAGAVIGGGIAAAVASKKASAAAVIPQPVTPQRPIVQVESGKPRFEPSAEVSVLSSQSLPPVLKNGHPGE